MIHNRTVAFLAPVILISAALLLVLAIILPQIAHAEPAVAGDWHPPSAQALTDSTATWLLGALVVLKAAEMALAWLAPRTESKLDDSALALIHRVRETGEEVLLHVRPAVPAPPVTGIESNR